MYQKLYMTWKIWLLAFVLDCFWYIIFLDFVDIKRLLGCIGVFFFRQNWRLRWPGYKWSAHLSVSDSPTLLSLSFSATYFCLKSARFLSSISSFSMKKSLKKSFPMTTHFLSLTLLSFLSLSFSLFLSVFLPFISLLLYAREKERKEWYFLVWKSSSLWVSKSHEIKFDWHPFALRSLGILLNGTYSS